MCQQLRFVAFCALCFISTLSAFGASPVIWAWNQSLVAGQSGFTSQGTSTVDSVGAEYEVLDSTDDFYEYWNVFKYDRYGNPVWSQSIPFLRETIPVAIQIDGQFNVYVAGNIPNDEGLDQAVLIKLGSSGGVNWIRTFQPSTDSATDVLGVGFDQNNNVYLGCKSTLKGNDNNRYYSFASYSPAGKVITSKETEDVDIPNVSFDRKGDMLVWGISNSSTYGGCIFELLGPSGAVVTSGSLDNTSATSGETQYGYECSFDPAGDYYIGSNIVVIPNKGPNYPYHQVSAYSAGGSLLWKTGITKGSLDRIEANDPGHALLLSDFFVQSGATLEMIGTNGKVTWTRTTANPGMNAAIDGTNGAAVITFAKTASDYDIVVQKYLADGTPDWSLPISSAQLEITAGCQFEGDLLYLTTFTTNGLLMRTASEGIAVATLALGPSTVLGGGQCQGTVTLTGAAVSGGLQVSLVSSDPDAVSVPSVVIVRAGAKVVRFTAYVANVDANETVQVFAICSQTSRTATITADTASLESFTAPAAVVGGASVSAKVTLNAPAGFAGKTVALNSGNTAVGMPSSVFIQPGATSASFTITTKTVAAATKVTLTAKRGVSLSATITVNP